MMAKDIENKKVKKKSKVKKAKKPKPQKYYAIKVGKNGFKDTIVRTWAECKEIVLGYDSVYKSFLTEKEALDYLNTVDVKYVQKHMKIGIEKRKKVKATTKPLHMRLDKDLMEDFEEKCTRLDLTPQKALEGMIKEWLY